MLPCRASKTQGCARFQYLGKINKQHIHTLAIKLEVWTDNPTVLALVYVRGHRHSSTAGMLPLYNDFKARKAGRPQRVQGLDQVATLTTWPTAYQGYYYTRVKRWEGQLGWGALHARIKRIMLGKSSIISWQRAYKRTTTFSFTFGAARPVSQNAAMKLARATYNHIHEQMSSTWKPPLGIAVFWS